MTDVETVLSHLPDLPGVYRMYDAAGKIIYVGKAKNLKRRVKSYFVNPERLTTKTRSLVERIHHIDYVIVDSEEEALLLECTLIKQFKPKYNIMLKDDKGYPYIRIDRREKYPSVALARKYVNDGALYFGPYYGTSVARGLVDILSDIYPLRTCGKALTGRKTGTVCLRYHLGKCLAPCRGVEVPEYKDMIEQVIRFLKGGYAEGIQVLEKKMLHASQRMDYEQAADFRDQIQKMKRLIDGQKMVLAHNVNIDVIGAVAAPEIGYACVQLFTVRHGLMIGSKVYETVTTEDDTIGNILSSFIISHYSDSNLIPPQIVTSQEPDNPEGLETFLSEVRGSKVEIGTVSRGDKRKLAMLAEKNASDHMKKSSTHAMKEKEKMSAALTELAETVGMEKAPYRIECFDISNIQGVDSVASMVVFEDGFPATAEYRRFKIKTVVGPNDFASMKEVVTRRFKRGQERDKGFAKMPDLVVVDGGKGQLAYAMEALKELGIEIPIMGLAERLEEIVLPDDVILLSRRSDALKLLQRIRDEAHRFAITYHRSLHRQRNLKSVLSNIPGIGTTRQKGLHRAFSSVERIKGATVEELRRVKGMNASAAQAVYDYFHREIH